MIAAELVDDVPLELADPLRVLQRTAPPSGWPLPSSRRRHHRRPFAGVAAQSEPGRSRWPRSQQGSSASFTGCS
jgi:hypothetical protein